MGKAYLHGGQAVNAALFAGHEPEWYERSRDNLLINGDFSVNQRGQNEYSEIGYGIDAWYNHQSGLKLIVNDGYISLVRMAASGSPPIEQRIETPSIFAGQTVTFSVEYRTAVANTYRLTINYAETETISGRLPVADTWSVFSFTRALPDDLPDLGFRMQNIGAWGGSVEIGDTIDLRRAKVEVGDHFTGWNETDPGEELHQCQRYGFALDAFQRFRASRVASGQIDFAIPCPVPLRATPLLPRDMSVVNLAGVGQQGYTFSVMSIRSGLLIIRAAKLNHGLSDALLQMSGEGVSYFDANL